MVDTPYVPGNRLPLAQEVVQLGEKLRRNLGNRIRNLCVDWREDGWVLHGCAASYYAKQLAQEAIMHATPLPITANQIRVLTRTW